MSVQIDELQGTIEEPNRESIRADTDRSEESTSEVIQLRKMKRQMRLYQIRKNRLIAN